MSKIGIYSFSERVSHFINKNITPKGNFQNSEHYWEERYRTGGTSGVGSYSVLAEFKAEVINSFVSEHKINTVLEFGCGDGNQLKYFKFKSYVGYDVSPTIIRHCRRLFKKDRSKQFKLMSQWEPLVAECTLSLDVIYHLIEDSVFNDYMSKLFQSSSRYVIIYSTNSNGHENNGVAGHVRHRKFTDWVESKKPEFILVEHLLNRYPYNGDAKVSTYADFYFYEKTGR